MDRIDRVITWLIAIWSMMIGFFSPIKYIVILIVAMATLDLITGYWSSLRKHNIFGLKKTLCHFSSQKSSKSVVKMFLYVFFISFVYLIEYALLSMDTTVLTRFISTIIVLTETKSISENLDIIVGKDIFTTLFRKMSKVFEKKINEQITDKRDE